MIIVATFPVCTRTRISSHCAYTVKRTHDSLKINKIPPIIIATRCSTAEHVTNGGCRFVSVTLHYHYHAPLQTLFHRRPFFNLSASKRASYQTQCCHLVCHNVFDAQVFLLRLSRRGTCGRPTKHSGIRSEPVDRI